MIYGRDFHCDKEKNQKLWNEVKPYLNLEDRDKAKCTFLDKGNELYVYAKHDDKYVRIYYFWKDARNKHLFLKKKQTSKG